MGYELPNPTDLGSGPLMGDLYVPLKFRQHLAKSMINPIRLEGRPNDFSAIVFGPPGTGKTSIIRAVAREVGWELIEIGPHDLAKHPESVEQAVVDTFQKIRDHAGERARAGGDGMAKTIVVFDEFDTLVAARAPGSDRAADFATTMMLPLLQELRDFAGRHGLIFFVLTNHIERFDPAVKRRGRFDLILPLGPPDHQARFMWFKKCLRELNARYKEKYNLEFITESEYKGQRPIRVEYTNLDVLARTSYGLSFADISAVCERVLDRRISVYPNLRSKGPRKNLIIVYTSNFIDWINNHRTSDPATQGEIEKFYRDADVYARGVYPYAHHHTIQEKAEQEFGSLTVEHNLGALEGWKAGHEDMVEFSLTNLSEFGVFYGGVDLKITMGDQREESSVRGIMLLPGRSTRKHHAAVIPSKRGVMSVAFSIRGRFHLRGGESVLDENSAELSGGVTYKREVRIA